MAGYVRFICTGRDAGIFQAAYDLMKSDSLNGEERSELDTRLKWFEHHLIIDGIPSP